MGRGLKEYKEEVLRQYITVERGELKCGDGEEREKYIERAREVMEHKVNR